MLDKLIVKYQSMQKKYGDKNLDSIMFGGCLENPDICLVFMNPTGRNIATSKDWHGLKSPWIGTKNVWNLFSKIGVIDENLYEEIKSKKGKDWTEEFANRVYENVANHKIYITNLAKCTQVDARPLKDEIFKEYLNLFYKELNIVKPKKVILFGNQVSSIVLNQKISVSQTRKQEFNYKGFKFYPVYYPVGNGSFNIDKAIEDINYIMNN
jgi:DNA polymerase